MKVAAYLNIIHTNFEWMTIIKNNILSQPVLSRTTSLFHIQHGAADPTSIAGALRPGKKIDEVKTIKRQPKTGWL